jgi:glutathione S-transferase
MSQQLQFYYHPTPTRRKSRPTNPNGKLPALLDDGIAIFDSSAILKQLAEKTHLYRPAAMRMTGLPAR